MLDIKFIRENPETIKEGCRKKHVKLDIDRLLELDIIKRECLEKIENLRHELNTISNKNKKPTLQEIAKGKKVKEEIKGLEAKFKEIEVEFNALIAQVPIPPATDVPEGKSEEENVLVRTWGKPPKFDFEPKDHITLMGNLDLLDLDRGAKIGGFRQYVIKNEAVLIEQSLLRWSLDILTKKGFIAHRPTVMVKEFALFGTGMFPKGKEETYKTDDELFLGGTTEVPLMAQYANEELSEKDLPLKMVGISEAFRREVGSYGRDIKGIMRVHEFWQTEQVVICKNDLAESIKLHEELLKNSEELLQQLELPYRVVNVCGGELSDGQVKRYDIETWVPSQEKYRETHSDSYLLDFQTRRLNIKYREKDGKLKFAHSLNQTAIAVPRILIPLIENNQQKDGSIKIPKVLQKYLGFKTVKK